MNQDLGRAFIDDRFELLSRLGEGGFGTVYLCRQKSFDRLVAVKLLHAESGGEFDSDLQLRFEREAHALSALRHKSIVTIYAYGEYQHNPYMVMEYVDGLSLSSVMEKCDGVEPTEVVRIASQICDALTCAHANGVIHRDLKPNNILLTKDGDVKLIDFGLARLLPNAGIKNQQLTEAGTALGTVLYMSPEQCVGQSADGRSDLYGLGCVMFHCLTGVPPFPGDHTVVVMQQHLDEALPRLAAVAPNKIFPSGLQEVLDSATAKEPRDRYQDAQAMSDDLQRLSKNLPVKAESIVGKAISPKLRVIRLPRKAVVLLLCTAVASVLILVVMYAQKRPIPAITSMTNPILQMSELQERLQDSNLKGKERALIQWELADTLIFLAGEQQKSVKLAREYESKASVLYTLALPAIGGDEAVNRALQSASVREISPAVRTHLICYAATVVIRQATAEPNYSASLQLFHRAEKILQHIMVSDSSEEYVNAGCYLYNEWASAFLRKHDWIQAERKYLKLDSVCRRYNEDHIFRAAALARLHEIGIRLNHASPGALETAEIILEDADPALPGPGFYMPALDATFDSELLSDQVDKAEKTLLASERKIKKAKFEGSVNLDAMHARIAVRRGRWSQALIDLENASRKSLQLQQLELSITSEYERAFLLTALDRPGAAKIIENANRLSQKIPDSAEVRKAVYNHALVMCTFELAKQREFAKAELILDAYGKAYPPSPDLAHMLDLRRLNTFRAKHW